MRRIGTALLLAALAVSNTQLAARASRVMLSDAQGKAVIRLELQVDGKSSSYQATTHDGESADLSLGDAGVVRLLPTLASDTRVKLEVFDPSAKPPKKLGEIVLEAGKPAQKTDFKPVLNIRVVRISK